MCVCVFRVRAAAVTVHKMSLPLLLFAAVVVIVVDVVLCKNLACHNVAFSFLSCSRAHRFHFMFIERCWSRFSVLISVCLFV